jgi:probable phosphoglycerate mutase
MQARMVAALEVLRSAHPGGVVVCFSHADPIKAAVAHAMGTHLDLFQRIVISPGSVSAISYVEGQAPAVLMVNSTSEPLSGLRVP